MVVKGKSSTAKKATSSNVSTAPSTPVPKITREKGETIDPSTNKKYHVKQDRLKEDPEIPNQRYCCISFVSPEKVIVNKEQWYFYNYHQNVIREYNRILNEFLGGITESADDDMVPLSSIVDLQKRMRRVFKYNEVKYDEWKERYADYEFKEGERLGQEFDRDNGFRTSVRGVKVRGVFNDLDEARTRATALQRMDTSHDVFVGQVGYWLPWHPESNKMDNDKVSYLNDDLNTLMAEYGKNQDLRSAHFEEQRQNQVQQQLRQNELTRKQIEAEKREIAAAKEENSEVASSQGATSENSGRVDDESDLPPINPELDNRLKEALSDHERKTLLAQEAERVQEAAANSQLANALSGGVNSDPWMSRNSRN